MLKYTLPSPLIQNIFENFLLPFPKRSLNYIIFPSYVKIYTLPPQYIFGLIAVLVPIFSLFCRIGPPILKLDSFEL